MTTDTLPQSSLTMLPAGQVELSRDQYQRLALRLGERTWEQVKPVRAFPLTAPESCVFLLDTEGKEIGFIASVAQLAAPSREALQETLSLDYLCTVVQAITSVKSRHGVSTWDVRTERGSRTVHIKDRNDIRKLPGNRVIITDVDGLRFEIPDASRLDDKSQGLLESES
jgi:hypothetical protein